MPVPSTIASLSTTPGSNPPTGGESPALTDDYLRTAFAFIKTLDDTKLAAVATANIADSAVTTPKLADGAVTFAKLQDIATARVLGRVTAGSGDTEELTAAQIKTMLAYAAIASSGSASDLTTGVVADARLPQVIGVSQTWQSVTGSRALGTTYTNSTGRPIVVSVRVLQVSGGSPSSVGLNVGGVVAAWSPSVAASSAINSWVSGIVPNGATYNVSIETGSMSLTSWSELR